MSPPKPMDDFVHVEGSYAALPSGLLDDPPVSRRSRAPPSAPRSRAGCSAREDGGELFDVTGCVIELWTAHHDRAPAQEPPVDIRARQRTAGLIMTTSSFFLKKGAPAGPSESGSAIAGSSEGLTFAGRPPAVGRGTGRSPAILHHPHRCPWTAAAVTHHVFSPFSFTACPCRVVENFCTASVPPVAASGSGSAAGSYLRNVLLLRSQAAVGHSPMQSPKPSQKLLLHQPALPPRSAGRPPRTR